MEGVGGVLKDAAAVGGGRKVGWMKVVRAVEGLGMAVADAKEGKGGGSLILIILH